MKYDAVVVGDFGKTTRVDVGIDVSSYTTLEIHFRKPGTTTWIVKTATIDADPTFITYKDLSGDDLWDTKGEVKVHAHVEKTGSVLTSAKPGIIPVVPRGQLN